MPPDYGRAFGLWRKAAGGHWDAYVGHAFVAGLAAGTLPRDSFLHYLRQDYLFLLHFVRAWALAAAKSDRPEEIRAALATADSLLNTEMPLHVRLCAQAGIPPDDLLTTPEADATLAYTRFVHAAGHAGDLCDLLAAMAPCIFGYGEIGLIHADSGGPYGDWTATYGGADYQQVCTAAGRLIDQALSSRLGPDWPDLPRAADLARQFTQATRLEAGFWQMGLDRG